MIFQREPCPGGSSPHVDTHQFGHRELKNTRCAALANEPREINLADTPGASVSCETCPLKPSRGAVLGPFTGEPVRHCLGHIYPFAGNDLWRWHVGQLIQRLPLFNGRRLVSVALDANTVGREEVEAALAGHAVELRFIANDRGTGENSSFRWGLEQLMREDERRETRDERREPEETPPSGSPLSSLIPHPSSCLFYWHSKGVSTREHDPKHNYHSVRRWADSMWRTCGDCWPLIQQQLETAHVTGSHRQPWPGTKCIHFAGTFFWVRLAALLGRPWHQLDGDRFAVERWPGQLFRPSETACLFDDRPRDRTAPGTLYRESTWSALSPQLEDFMTLHRSQPPESATDDVDVPRLQTANAECVAGRDHPPHL